MTGEGLGYPKMAPYVICKFLGINVQISQKYKTLLGTVESAVVRLSALVQFNSIQLYSRVPHKIIISIHNIT
jgi:hypothetical protein